MPTADAILANIRAEERKGNVPIVDQLTGLVSGVSRTDLARRLDVPESSIPQDAQIATSAGPTPKLFRTSVGLSPTTTNFPAASSEMPPWRRFASDLWEGELGAKGAVVIGGLLLAGIVAVAVMG